MNLPIFRAKKLNEDEYVVGYFQKLTDGRMLICYVELVDEDSDDFLFGDVRYIQWFEIDPSTLAIHFPNMVDVDNKPIFASLNKNRKGGDILNHRGVNEHSFVDESTICFLNGEFTDLTNKDVKRFYKKSKIKGIQK